MPAAPPTTPGQLSSKARPAVWPLAIGIICIVMGAIGTLNYGSNAVAAPFMTRFMGDMVATSGQQNAVLEDSMDAMAAYQVTTIIVQTSGLALSIALLVAGIGLCLRRRWSVRLLLVWSPIKIIHALVLGLTTGLMISTQFRAVVDADPSAPQQLRIVFSVMAVVVGALTALFVLILPIVLLFWLRRKRVRETVAGWTGAATISDS